MATIDNEDIIKEIIANNGHYYDDPIVIKIVQYTNRWGGRTHGVVYERDDPNRYRESEFVINPKVIFERK